MLEIERRVSDGDAEAERLLGLIFLDGSGVKKNVNEGFRLLRQSASRGDSISECDYGFCFHTGQGTHFDASEAFRHYSRSAMLGCAKGSNNAGFCLYNGEGTKADKKRAVNFFETAANGEVPEGLCNLGYCYEYGEGVDANPRKAAEMYKRAAELGNAHAMYNFGRCLATGIGVKKDDKKAVEYFRKAAEKHDEFGELYFNLMLFKGRGIKKNEQAAAAYFQRAAISGNPHAQCYFGIALEFGKGVQLDVDKASAQFRLSADNGDPHGQFCLGELFLNGNSVYQSNEEAARLFKLAADNGYGRAQMMFARCLEEGIGVKIFRPGAISYYKAAADKGKAYAQFKYGDYVEKGEFIEQNYDLAAKYYKMSADQNCPDALYALGSLYERGLGVPEADLHQAGLLYKSAADKRHALGEDRYGKFLQRGRGGVAENPSLGVEYFTRSASQKCALGQYHLGRSYETGLGANQNFEVAVNNYKLSADQDYPPAMYHLGLLYKSGGGDVISKNEKEAFKYFQLAALNNHVKGIYQYAICFRDGIGIQRNIEEAKNQFKAAALKDHVESMYELAKIHQSENNEEMAEMWFSEAAFKNHAPSQCELGKILLARGSEKEAFELFEKSDKGGYAEGQYWHGKCYEESHGCDQNFNLAYECYKRAYRQQHPQATTQAGLYELRGVGTSQNNNTAIQKLREAGELGDPHAFFLLGRCCEFGDGGQIISQAEAVTYYEKAAKRGDSDGMFSLGLMFAKSKGGLQKNDMVRAAQLFEESALHDNPCGMMCYSCCLIRAEGVEYNEEKALDFAKQAIEKGIYFTSFGRNLFEFETESAITNFLMSKQSQKGAKQKKYSNLNVNNGILMLKTPTREKEGKTVLEEASKVGHQGSMFVLSTIEDIPKENRIKLLAESAPWLERGPVITSQKNKKVKRSLKMIPMTKKSITKHHKKVITKPDSKHTFICV